MKRGTLFWGIALILLGGLFLLQALGLVKDVLGFFWPLLIMLVGLWILLGAFWPRRSGGKFEIVAEDDPFEVDLQGAQKVEIDFDTGGGSVRFSGGAPADKAVVGVQGTAMSYSGKLSGDTLYVDMDAGPSILPFIGPDGGEWRFKLNQDVPVHMKMDAGAATLDCDFTDVKLASLEVDCGASTLNIHLPANAGKTFLSVESGAASINIHVPEGVAARIEMEQGVSTVQVNESRFPRQAGSLYQSADYDSAANKVEMKLEGGANTVNVV